ncbi:hypothetical protein DPSP01_010961 [Paraphaeosphaeria sporulosa]
MSMGPVVPNCPPSRERPPSGLADACGPIAGHISAHSLKLCIVSALESHTRMAGAAERSVKLRSTALLVNAGHTHGLHNTAWVQNRLSIEPAMPNRGTSVTHGRGCS